MIHLTPGKPRTSGKKGGTVSPRQSVSRDSGSVGTPAYAPDHFTKSMTANNWPPGYRPSFVMLPVGRGFRFLEKP